MQKHLTERGYEKSRLDFHIIKSVDEISQLVKNYYPYSRVLVLFSNALDVSIINSFYKNSLRPVFVQATSTYLTVDNLSGLFNLYDDVRAVVCLSLELQQIARYYCSVKGTRLFLLANMVDFDIFDNALLIENDGQVDKWIANLQTSIVFFDDDRYFSDCLKLLIFEWIYLLDEYINALINSDERLIRKRENFYLLVNTLKDNGADERTYFERWLRFRVDDYFSGNSNFSCLKIKDLINLRGRNSKTNNTDIAKRALRFLKKVFHKEESCLLYSLSYSERLSLLNLYFGLNRLNVINKLKEQTEKINAKKQTLIDFFSANLTTIKRLIDLSLDILGGEKQENNIYDEIMLAGDTPFGINLMSVIREIF